MLGYSRKKGGIAWSHEVSAQQMCMHFISDVDFQAIYFTIYCFKEGPAIPAFLFLSGMIFSFQLLLLGQDIQSESTQMKFLDTRNGV